MQTGAWSSGWNCASLHRLGFRNIGDIDNGEMRKTSYTTLLTGQNIYRYSYVVPMQVEANVTVRF